MFCRVQVEWLTGRFQCLCFLLSGTGGESLLQCVLDYCLVGRSNCISNCPGEWQHILLKNNLIHSFYILDLSLHVWPHCILPVIYGLLQMLYSHLQTSFSMSFLARWWCTETVAVRCIIYCFPSLSCSCFFFFGLSGTPFEGSLDLGILLWLIFVPPSQKSCQDLLCVDVLMVKWCFFHLHIVAPVVVMGTVRSWEISL